MYQLQIRLQELVYHLKINNSIKNEQSKQFTFNQKKQQVHSRLNSQQKQNYTKITQQNDNQNQPKYYLKISQQSKKFIKNPQITDKVIIEGIPFSSHKLNLRNYFVSFQQEGKFNYEKVKNQIYYQKQTELTNFRTSLKFQIKKEAINKQNTNKEKKLGKVEIFLNQDDIKKIKTINKLAKQNEQNKQFEIKSSKVVLMKKIQLQDSKDEEAYLLVSICVKPLLFYTQLPPPTPLSFQNHLTTLILSEINQLELKNNQLEEENSFLESQNATLSRQLKQKEQLFQMNENLRFDKVKLMKKRLNKAKEEEIRVKQMLSMIVNLVNEYGDCELVDKVSEIVVGNQFAADKSLKQTKSDLLRSKNIDEKQREEPKKYETRKNQFMEDKKRQGDNQIGKKTQSPTKKSKSKIKTVKLNYHLKNNN